MPTTQASADAQALPRELTEFLVELSTALHKYTMYPDGHPLLETAATGIARRLKPILAERPTFSIGVARDHLLIDGMPTDRNVAVLRELAVKLYRREIGGVRIQEGVEDIELVEVMKTVARDGSKPGERNSAKIAAVKDGEGAAASVPAREWPHVRLLPLSYDQLELEDANARPDDPERGNWAAQLWTRLAHSAVGAEMSGAIMLPEITNDPLALAALIEQRESDPEFDKGILGMFSSFMDEIRSKGGQAAKALRSRVSDLVGSLTPQTLQRLLKTNTDWAQQKQLMFNATHALAADTVLDLAKAVSSASAHTMSEALLLLLAKLAKHADKGSPARRDKADAALRDNVRQLINDWDHAAELPEESYWQTLEKLIAEPGKEQAASGMYDVPAEHVVQLSLDTEVFGTTSKHAVAEMVKRGQIAALLALVDATPDGNKVVYTLRRHSRQHRHDPPPAARPPDRFRSPLPARVARGIPGGRSAARCARARGRTRRALEALRDAHATRPRSRPRGGRAPAQGAVVRAAQSVAPHGTIAAVARGIQRGAVRAQPGCAGAARGVRAAAE